MRQFLTRKLVSLASRTRGCITIWASNRDRRRFSTSGRALTSALRFVVLSDADLLVIVGRIELGAIGAPGRVLEDAVDLAQARSRKPQRDDLSDPHHDVPAHDFDAGWRKGLVIA